MSLLNKRTVVPSSVAVKTTKTFFKGNAKHQVFFLKIRCKGAVAHFVGAAKRNLISSIYLKNLFVGAAADFVGANCTHKTP